MKNTFKKVFIGFMAFAMATGSFAQQRAHKKDNESYPKEWKQIARMEQDSFFLTDEARRIAENVLAFQRCTGGWPNSRVSRSPFASTIRSHFKPVSLYLSNHFMAP